MTQAAEYPDFAEPDDTSDTITRAQGQIAIDALLTDGRVTRERAGKGWRYSAKAAE